MPRQPGEGASRQDWVGYVNDLKEQKNDQFPQWWNDFIKQREAQGRASMPPPDWQAQAPGQAPAGMARPQAPRMRSIGFFGNGM